jgi:anti-sigma factor RsiW
MACARYQNAIHDLVDGTLGPLRGAELELHLETCDDCRALLADLRAIAGTARSLEPMEPPPHAWERIATTLRAEGRVTRGPTVPRRNYALLALAATLLLAVSASLFVLSRGRGAEAPATAATDVHPEGNAEEPDPVQRVAKEMALSEQHFQNAVELVKQSADAAGPETAKVLQSELEVMNQAIAERQAALLSNPQSAQANRSYYELLRQKIRFLQDTIALMNEMRQGDAAGAAQIVEGKS